MGICAGLGAASCGAAWACGGACAGAAGVGGKAGAVLAGSRETGLWAVWQEEAIRAKTASSAIRTWSFATRIFLYEIRIASGGYSPVNSIKNRTPGSALGQRRKGTTVITFGTAPHRYPWGLLFRRRKPAKGLKEIDSISSSVPTVAGSDAPVVWTPSLDRLLNVRPGQFFRERALHELGYFGIRSEAQPDELAFG